VFAGSKDVPNVEDCCMPTTTTPQVRFRTLDGSAESMRYVRRYPEELPVLAGLLPQITVPVTIINGRNDRVVRSPTRNISTSGCPPAAS